MLFILVEQVMRPRHEIVQCSVSLDHRRLRAVEEIEATIQALSEHRRAHRAQTRRGELDGEWESIEAAYDLGDGSGIVGSELEVRVRGSGAFDEQAHRRRFRERRDVATERQDRQRSDAPDLFAGKPENLAARREDRHIGAPTEQPIDERRDRRPEVLAVVENEQGAAAAQVLHQRVFDREVLALLDVDGGCDRRDRRRRVANRRELDHEHLASELLPEVGRDAQREPRLADAARTGQREEPITPHTGDDLRDDLLAPDEGCRRDRQAVGHRRSLRRGAGPEQRRIIGEDLVFEVTERGGWCQAELFPEQMP